MSIHPTALIDEQATLAEDVSVGAYSVIGADVHIGAGTRIGPHVVIDGPTRIGRDNHIYQFASLGADPQDKKFHGEHSLLEIGDRNNIREFVTFNRGTSDGGGVTRIGDDNWLMAYVHIAHDCIVGNHVVFANSASLAGHVVIEDHVTLGGFSLIHQFCRVGAYAFTAMGAAVNGDVLPFITVAGSYAKPRGINSEGLRRNGFSSERIMGIRRAYRTLHTSGLTLVEAVAQLSDSDNADVQHMLAFMSAGKRALLR